MRHTTVHLRRLAGTTLIVGLAHALSFTAAADEEDDKRAKALFRLHELKFCMKTADDAKRLFLTRLSEKSSTTTGCLHGMRPAHKDANVCEQLLPDAKPKDGEGGMGGEGGKKDGPCVAKTGEVPALACTTCKAEDAGNCATKTVISGVVPYFVTEEREPGAEPPPGGVKFLIRGSYGGPAKVAKIENKIAEDGHEGPFDLVSAVVDASFEYTQAILDDEVKVDDAYYPAGTVFACSITDTGQKWISTKHIDRDCDEPFTPSPSTP